MKLIGIGGAVIALFGAMAMAVSPQALAQQAHEYWFLTVSDDEMKIDYIDATSITPSDGDVRRAWTWTFNSTGADMDAGSHQVTLIEANCRTREARALQMAFYDSRGNVNVHQSENATEQWHYVVPETFGEIQLQFICADPAKRNYFGIPLAKDATPEQHAHQFDAQRSFQMPSFAEVVDRMSHDAQAGTAGTGAAHPGE